MTKFLSGIPPWLFVLVATVLEATGDAIVRKAIYDHAGVARAGLMLGSAVLLFGYGFMLNLAPVTFGQIFGLYIGTLFIVWQIVNAIAFRALPTLPVIVGGALVIAGGAIITYWKPQ